MPVILRKILQKMFKKPQQLLKVSIALLTEYNLSVNSCEISTFVYVRVPPVAAPDCFYLRH